MHDNANAFFGSPSETLSYHLIGNEIIVLRKGKWETAYKRYRLWNRTGLWQRLLAVLGDDALKDSGQVSL